MKQILATNLPFAQSLSFFPGNKHCSKQRYDRSAERWHKDFTNVRIQQILLGMTSIYIAAASSRMIRMLAFQVKKSTLPAQDT